MANDYKVRRRGGFLDRNGIAPINKTLQIDEFEPGTRVALKNKTVRFLNDYESFLRTTNCISLTEMGHQLAEELFGISITSREATYEGMLLKIYGVFDECTYGEILDTIEYLVSTFKIPTAYSYYGARSNTFRDIEGEYNEVFEREYVGYRFVKGIITPITNPEETSEVAQAVSSPYEKVSGHMVKAVQLFSSRDPSNYKTVIAECSHALECLLNILSKKTKKTLGEALDEYLKSKQNVHPAFAKSIKDFYGYASDSPGIRHDGNGPDFGEGFDETKLVLVYTSAIINYLVATARK